MVNKCRYQLLLDEHTYYARAYVKLVRLEAETTTRVNICGANVRLQYATKLQKGGIKGELAVDGKVVRINLDPNNLNLKIAPELSRRFLKCPRMFTNDSFNKSILKQSTENECKTSSKTVSFSNTFYISPISPRRREKSPSPIKDYEFAFKEYLKSVQMNGSCSTPEKEKVEASPVVHNDNSNAEMDDDDFDEESMEVEYLDPPKRKRGRPKGSGKLKTIETPPKKRGWPLGLSRKMYNEMKSRTVVTPASVETGAPTVVRKRGRPRKIIAFGFQTIVSDIKTVSLPSDLWSAHVSVTAKKSQVCFTRVVQAVSNSVPVECDRSVKFNGSVNYLVRINNRDVELLAAPPTVNSLRDVEILLGIVNEIGINDPVLEYHNR